MSWNTSHRIHGIGIFTNYFTIRINNSCRYHIPFGPMDPSWAYGSQNGPSERIPMFHRWTIWLRLGVDSCFLLVAGFTDLISWNMFVDLLLKLNENSSTAYNLPKSPEKMCHIHVNPQVLSAAAKCTGAVGMENLENCLHFGQAFCASRSIGSNFWIQCYRVLKGGCSRGGGNWGTLRIPREDWGTLGNIRED